MKRKIMFLGAALLLMWGISGCTGSMGRETARESGAEEFESGESETQNEKTAVERQWKNAKKQFVQQPVLGVDEDGYEGFRYLVPYKLESDHYKAVVYLPEDEYAATQYGNALAENSGVWVTVQLDPLLGFDTGNDSLEEILQAYTEIDKRVYEEMDDCWEVEVSEVKTLDDNRVEAEFSYITYNPYSEVYVSYWGVYYLVKTDDGRIFFVNVEVEEEGVNWKTEAILEELGEYLQVELEYDRETMMAKAAKYTEADNTEEENGNMASTGFWTFELPEGWEKNTVASTNDEYIFSPGGSLTEDRAIYISEKYMGYDIDYIKEMDEDKLVEIFEVLLGEDEAVDNVSVVGDTAAGYALKIEYAEQRVNAVGYIIFGNQSAYIVMAVESGEGTEAFEAAEHIINTVKVK